MPYRTCHQRWTTHRCWREQEQVQEKVLGQARAKAMRRRVRQPRTMRRQKGRLPDLGLVRQKKRHLASLASLEHRLSRQSRRRRRRREERRKERPRQRQKGRRRRHLEQEEKNLELGRRIHQHLVESTGSIASWQLESRDGVEQRGACGGYHVERGCERVLPATGCQRVGLA